MTADLDHAITVLIDTNNVAAASLASGKWDDAVERYKSAGSVGAQEVGPAIDARTHGQSGPLTQQAWVINGHLHEINSGPFNGTAATEADAKNAAALFAQMYNLYNQANTTITSDPKVAQKPGHWTPPALPATSVPKSSSLPVGALLGGALVGAAVIGVALGTLPAALGGALAGTLVGAWMGRTKGT